MDYSPIVNEVLSALWYLVPISILAAVLKSAWFKGVMGEVLVNILLKLFLPKNDYHLINNVTLPTEDGTTQIDHIVVSKYGLFVIETKNMKGWIFGSAQQKQWTQKIFKQSYKFQNPLHQNYKHTKTLEACLGIDADKIFSVIVFIGDSVFKTKVPANVTYAGGCVKYIKSIKDVAFTDKQVNEIASAIEAGRLKRGIKTNIAHTQHVKDIIKVKTQDKQYNANTCPKCESPMVMRQAKKGANAGQQFWGCSAFPKCRAVVAINA